MKLEDILSLGCAKYMVGFFIEDSDLGKDYFIDMYAGHMTIQKDEKKI